MNVSMLSGYNKKQLKNYSKMGFAWGLLAFLLFSDELGDEILTKVPLKR